MSPLLLHLLSEPPGPRLPWAVAAPPRPARALQAPQAPGPPPQLAPQKPGLPPSVCCASRVLAVSSRPGSVRGSRAQSLILTTQLWTNDSCQSNAKSSRGEEELRADLFLILSVRERGGWHHHPVRVTQGPAHGPSSAEHALVRAQSPGAQGGAASAPRTRRRMKLGSQPCPTCSRADHPPCPEQLTSCLSLLVYTFGTCVQKRLLRIRVSLHLGDQAY
ncbi:hypothetical protein CB1_000709004 [Camelus ferus]|nr:hypothetical protein CB1_000709004 [Camelus ferus]